jgi:hypothetical protein
MAIARSLVIFLNRLSPRETVVLFVRGMDGSSILPVRCLQEPCGQLATFDLQSVDHGRQKLVCAECLSCCWLAKGGSSQWKVLRMLKYAGAHIELRGQCLELASQASPFREVFRHRLYGDNLYALWRYRSELDEMIPALQQYVTLATNGGDSMPR